MAAGGLGDRTMACRSLLAQRNRRTLSCRRLGPAWSTKPKLHNGRERVQDVTSCAGAGGASMGGGGCVLSGRGPWGRRRVAPSPVFPTVSTRALACPSMTHCNRTYPSQRKPPRNGWRMLSTRCRTAVTPRLLLTTISALTPYARNLVCGPCDHSEPTRLLLCGTLWHVQVRAAGTLAVQKDVCWCIAPLLNR